jgi:hypothetical protein
LSQVRWCAVKDGNNWYAARQPSRKLGNRKIIRMHQEILPGHPEVDHRNGDGLNNQRNNLRPATRLENRRNSRGNKNNSSGFKGVHWNSARKKWYATIRVAGKSRFLGGFIRIKEAVASYDAAAKQLFGKFAYLNTK